MERKVWGQLEENIDRLELEIRDMRTQVNRVIDLRTADACVFGEMAIRLHERLGDARKTKGWRETFGCRCHEAITGE